MLVAAGACVGSFANVVAWRLPREESVVWPGSHCPKCGQGVRWHDNVPVLGWICLLGHCRDCHQGISSRYPLVELLSALLWLSAWWGHGLLAASDLLGLAFLNLLAGIVLVDLLAVPHVPTEVAAVFFGLFILAVAAQRWVPAT